MPNAPKLLVAVGALATLAACHKDTAQQDGSANVPAVENTTANLNEIEALPADESSTTPSNQLVNGYDSPDVNDTTEMNAD